MTTQRYWVSWWSGNYESEGCTNPPFQTWVSGEKDRPGNSDKTDLSLCAVIDAERDGQADILAALRHHFPDHEIRFINAKNADFVPGDRFPGFESRTSLLGELPV